VRYIKPTHVGFRPHVKIASRIVSYQQILHIVTLFLHSVESVRSDALMHKSYYGSFVPGNETSTIRKCVGTKPSLISGSMIATDDFIHHSTLMLESTSYIRCLFIDFSQAFDVVRHSILLSKISRPTVSGMHYQVQYLTGCK